MSGPFYYRCSHRRVIDVLPDRQRDTVIAWLQKNPQVEIICRDRSPGYGAEATEAAPQARQVADRWHLFENASAAFLAAVRSEMPCLSRALAPSGVIDRATLTCAERLRWDERIGHAAGASLGARTIVRCMTTERDTGPAQTALINAVIEKAMPALIEARDILDHWSAMAATSKLTAFAAGVEADKDAVAAAISSPWSSGQVEGKITRLKSIKRQMYGCANLDLIKARIMAPA